MSRRPPIPERGPDEVRQEIHAFTLMQELIRRFVDDRTQTLADLDEMERMVFASLALARGETAPYTGHYLVFPDHALMRRTLRNFVSWLLAELGLSRHLEDAIGSSRKNLA